MPTKSTKYDSVASKCNGSNPKITFESNQAIQAIENIFFFSESLKEVFGVRVPIFLSYYLHLVHNQVSF